MFSQEIDNMLTNSLSLDEEEAVQAELKALQQETVSSPCSSFETAQSLIATPSVTCSGRCGYTAHTAGCTYSRTCTFRTRFAALRWSTTLLTIPSERSTRPEEERTTEATERVAILA